MPATILVADDNSNIQRMVTHELRGEGFNVIAVGNGEAAVRKISELHPDLVLADIFMPVRTGYEVCEFVKKNEALASIPVVLLIGAFDPLDEAEVQRVRADGVLKKPFVPPDPLVLTVKQLLERSGAGTAKPDSGKAGVPARSPTAAAPTFDFVGNDHMPTPVQAFVPPTPPVPRPYPAEPPPPPSSLTHAKPTEPAARVEEEKVEEEEPTPQDWITRPEPITYLGREEEKPLVFSDLLQETLPAETGRPLSPEEEARELLKEKTSAFYDFDALETGDSQNAVAEARPGGASSAPAETESPSLRGADQVIPAEAPWESSAGETPALNPSVRDGSAVEESKPEHVFEDVSTTGTPPATNLQGWLQETLLLGAGMPRRPATAGLPTDSGGPTEASVFDSPARQTPTEVPFEPPPTETEPVLGTPVAQPLELSESALEEGSKLPEPPEEVTLDSQPLVSQLAGTEEGSFAPLSGVSHGPVPDYSKAQEASEPIEEVPMERQWVVEETFGPPDRIGAPSGSEPESGREELPAPFAQNLVEQAFEVDEPPPLRAEETTTPERFWSEPEPPQVEETTESIRTEPFASEPFLTEPSSTAATPAGESAASPDFIGASEESSVAEEPFLAVPVSAEPVEIEQPSASAPAGVGAAFAELVRTEAPSSEAPSEISPLPRSPDEPASGGSEPVAPGHAGEPFLSPAIEPEEPRPVEGVEPEFQLTPPAAPPPENGELVEKVVEEVMSRLSPDLLEQISRELVKPLAEAVLKRNRPKPE